LQEILKQPQYVPMSLENMVIELFAGTRGFTDNVPLERMGAWETAMLRFMESNYPEIVKDIATRKQIIPETEQKLRAALDSFMSTWS
ncbi:MAG TPA: F0F1 ATP synthase subunit alpha, partial [Anaerolineales bacterium]|nr:F0F1 ATP synthase subunit alpha [Anaerolineales bacterium]